MKRFAPLSALTILALGLAAPAAAQSSGMQGMDMKMEKKAASKEKAHQGSGTVKSVDAAKGTITIDHEAINSINWPAMLMTFKASNKAMLKDVQPGEKIDFTLVQSGNDYTVTRIKPRK